MRGRDERDQVGEGVTDVKEGNRVMAMPYFGGYTDTLVVPAFAIMGCGGSPPPRAHRGRAPALAAHPRHGAAAAHQHAAPINPHAASRASASKDPSATRSSRSSTAPSGYANVHGCGASTSATSCADAAV